MYIVTYMYTHIQVCVCIYRYIQRERERDTPLLLLLSLLSHYSVVIVTSCYHYCHLAARALPPSGCSPILTNDIGTPDPN